jgi:COP9 signalosome complex subunit 5
MSVLALSKILNHASQGKNMEVMGMLFGRRDADSIIIFDVLPLPVEGTETRVNAGQDAMEFQGNNLDLMTYVKIINLTFQKYSLYYIII